MPLSREALAAHRTATEGAAACDRVWLFHAHVYFDEREPAQIEAARAFADRIASAFTDGHVALNHFVPRPVGPHPRAMFEVLFTRAAHTRFVSWLAFERPAGTSVMIHPLTDSQLLDHTTRALWIGTQLPLDTAPLIASDDKTARTGRSEEETIEAVKRHGAPPPRA